MKITDRTKREDAIQLGAIAAAFATLAAFAGFIFFVANPPPAQAAGSAMTFTYETPRRDSLIQKVTVSWTSDDTTGAVSGTTDQVLNGYIVRVATNPGDGGAAPTDDYDITLKDSLGLDFFERTFDDVIDRDTANNEQAYPVLGDNDATPTGVGLFVPVFDAITIAVTNAGNSNTGQIVLWIAKR